MSLYELLFEIHDPAESALEQVEAEFGLLYDRHGSVDHLAVWVHAQSTLDGAKAVADCLDRAGIQAIHLLEDLVTRQDIADRLNTSRQAVGNWVRGNRRDNSFLTYYLVAGGVWLWGEVVEWCGNNGISVAYAKQPTGDDVVTINHWISQLSLDMADLQVTRPIGAPQSPEPQHPHHRVSRLCRRDPAPTPRQ